MDNFPASALEAQIGFADARAELAGLRADLADFRVEENDRHAELMAAIVSLRDDMRGHSRGD